MKYVLDSAHGGKNWKARTKNHKLDIGGKWGSCGVNSETDLLKSVILHKPGKELNLVDDASKYLWTQKMDVSLALYQHEKLAETYKRNGIEVTFGDPNEEVPGKNIILPKDGSYLKHVELEMDNLRKSYLKRYKDSELLTEDFQFLADELGITCSEVQILLK